MKQYTIEELNTIGTEIDFGNTIPSRVLDLGDSTFGKTSHTRNKRLYITSKTKNVKGVNYVLFDEKGSATKNMPYSISLDELRKHNLIKEDNLENQEIEVGDTVEITNEDYIVNHTGLKNGKTFVISELCKTEGFTKCWVTPQLSRGAIAIENIKLIKKANKNMNKEMIGYKLKPEFKYQLNHICSIVGISEKTEENLNKFLQKNNWGEFKRILENLKVLELWFDAQYKISKEIVKLNSDSGVFELEVSKEGIYYAPDSKWLNIDDFINTESHFTDIFNVAKNSQSKFTSKEDTYKFSIHTVNMGCRKNVLIEDLTKVLTVYNTLKNE